jgi:hypothetical protein
MLAAAKPQPGYGDPKIGIVRRGGEALIKLAPGLGQIARRQRFIGLTQQLYDRGVAGRTRSSRFRT